MISFTFRKKNITYPVSGFLRFRLTVINFDTSTFDWRARLRKKVLSSNIDGAKKIGAPSDSSDNESEEEGKAAQVRTIRTTIQMVD